MRDRTEPCASGSTIRSWSPSRSAYCPLIPVALRYAQLNVSDPMAHSDALIAATAIVHGLIVVTRNTQDFEVAGVGLVDPWQPRR